MTNPGQGSKASLKNVVHSIEIQHLRMSNTQYTFTTNLQACLKNLSV